MSHLPISRSGDLKRLRDEGFTVTIQAGHLVVADIPYVNATREVVRGSLISKLCLSNDRTTTPDTHVVMFSGDFPCDHKGVPLEEIRHGSRNQAIGQGLIANYSFSRKIVEDGKKRNYRDYYELVVAYAEQLSQHAVALAPDVTARVFKVVEPESEDSPFRYVDSASSRAGITALSRKLELECIVIVGLGGTGAYVLDYIVKTPVRAIHLYDGDRFQQHTAFRSPGAASRDELDDQPFKVDYHARQYGEMHRGVIPHSCYLNEDNIHLLEKSDFVFVCVDNGAAKPPIIQYLRDRNIPFIDVGMGVQEVDGSLRGATRVTTSTASFPYDEERKRISYAPSGVADEYGENIQLVELNALNAALAVIKYKKLLGFYHDFENEHDSSFTIDGNSIANGDYAPDN